MNIQSAVILRMSGVFSETILEAFGAAREGLARAEERLVLFPEPAILIAHIRAAEQEALAWLEGESFIPDQLAMNYGYSPRAWRRWPFAFVQAFERVPRYLPYRPVGRLSTLAYRPVGRQPLSPRSEEDECKPTASSATTWNG